MANSFIQKRNSSGTSASVSLAYTSNNTAGNLLVVSIGWNSLSSTGLAVSDTANGSWTQDKVQIGVTGASCAIYSLQNCAAGANTVTVSLGSSATIELVIYEFSGGGNTLWSLTTTAGAASGATTAPNPGIMTVNSGDACVSYSIVAGTATAGAAGWTFAATPNGNGEQYFISSSTSVTGSFTPSQTHWAAASSAYKSASATFHFAMALADTSTVSTLGLEVQRHFPMAIADTSTVTALGLEVQRHFPLAIADTSAVLALGLEVQRHLSLVIADTSTVSALGFHIFAPLDFPVHAADTTSVLALGFHQTPPLHFPMAVVDTTTVLALGLEVKRRFSVQITDTSAVQLTYGLRVPHYPVLVADTSAVFIGFENDHATPLLIALTVPPYAGQNQGARINVPARIAYKYIDWEESCWVMPPYAIFYPGPPPMLLPMGYPAPAPAPSVGRIRWVSGLFR